MPRPRAERTLASLIGATLWMALVLGLYYWVHKPQTPALAEALGAAHISWDAAAAAFAAGFAATFAADFDGPPGQLTAAERDAADRLTADVYGAPAWIHRR